MERKKIVHTLDTPYSAVEWLVFPLLVSCIY